MPIGMIIEVCVIDDEPIETSKAYETLCRLVGPEKASLWTKEIVIMPPGDDDTCSSKSS